MTLKEKKENNKKLQKILEYLGEGELLDTLNAQTAKEIIDLLISVNGSIDREIGETPSNGKKMMKEFHNSLYRFCKVEFLKTLASARKSHAVYKCIPEEWLDLPFEEVVKEVEGKMYNSGREVFNTLDISSIIFEKSIITGGTFKYKFSIVDNDRFVVVSDTIYMKEDNIKEAFFDFYEKNVAKLLRD